MSEDDQNECGYAPLTTEQQELVTENRRLVLWVAQKFYLKGEPIPQDIVSEGYFGLVIAASKFDPNRGIKFGTYAVHWIRARILDYMMRYRGPLRFMTTAAHRKVCFGLGRLPAGVEDTDQIAEHFGVSREVVEGMRTRMIGKDVHFDDIRDGMRFELADRREDQEELLGCAEEVREAKRVVDSALDRLDSRERYILRTRYLGEDDEQMRTLASVGEEIGVSRERVRQIELQAKKNLRAVLTGGSPTTKRWGRPRKGVAV